MKPTTTRPGFALLLIVLALNASAQDDAGRASREREALRRAQAALKQSQDQQATLTREKADLAAQTGQLGDTVKRAEAQLSGSRSEAARLRAELARASSELEASRTRADAEKAADKAASQARIDDLSQRLGQAMRLAADRAQTVASLTTLLERATQSLLKAEKANAQMHAVGVKMIERLRNWGSADSVLEAEPVLGFGQIRLENNAEELRDRLDEFKLASPVK